MGDRARLRIAFQGEIGSFSDEAIQQLWGGDVQRLPYRDFADVTASVAAGVADRGVLPIENTMAGSIAGAHDALSAMPGLHVVAETVVAVHHCLLGAALGEPVDLLDPRGGATAPRHRVGQFLQGRDVVERRSLMSQRLQVLPGRLVLPDERADPPLLFRVARHGQRGRLLVEFREP